MILLSFSDWKTWSIESQILLKFRASNSVLTDCTCSLAQLKEDKENIHFHARVTQNM